MVKNETIKHVGENLIELLCQNLKCNPENTPDDTFIMCPNIKHCFYKFFYIFSVIYLGIVLVINSKGVFLFELSELLTQKEEEVIK